MSINKRHQRLKIAYVSAEDPHSKRSWSGTTYYMARALQRYCGDVSYLGPIMSFERRFVGRAMQELSSRLLKKNIAYDRLLFVAKKQARIVQRRLEGQHFDIIFSPIGSPEVAFLKTTIPIVLASDLTFALQRDYNPLTSNLLSCSVRQGEQVEAMAYNRARALLYPTQWAAQSARADYGIDEQNIHIVPLGANLDSYPPRTIAERKQKSGQCRLLFPALGWERKGGAIAFETLLKLEEMGIEAELIVCGCVPPKEFVHERMKVIPFLDKCNEEQSRKLAKLYEEADFIILPTRADCFGLVFCEGNAYGVPAITARTGGVPEVVQDGINGYVLPFEARGDAYAAIIAKLYRDDHRYKALVASSRATFEAKYTWDAWGMAVNAIFQHLLSPENVLSR